MKRVFKIVLCSVLFLTMLAAGISCSHSGSDDGAGGGAPDIAGAVLLSEWSATRSYTQGSSTYHEEYYYYLYSNNTFTYRIVAQVDSDSATQAMYFGRWELYAGNQNHTYHFSYDTAKNTTVHTWGDLDITGTVMNVYVTENRVATDVYGTIYSTQFPAVDASFTR